MGKLGTDLLMMLVKSSSEIIGLLARDLSS
jgi:hypothetical protein